jgi:hypothetical protein
MEKVYAGGGLAYNSLDQGNADSAVGYQFFGGYNLSDIFEIGDDIGLSAEAGWAVSGDFETCVTFFGQKTCASSSADGLWAAGVIDYGINDEIKVLGRVGFDLGDDDGVIFGGGGEYKVNDQVSARLEYVIHPNYKGFQLNGVYYFGN